MAQDIWEIVKSSRNLPTLPIVAMKVVSLAQNPDVTTKELADTISSDPALAAKILRIVNSPYYGFASQVSTLTRAVALLGLVPLKFLILSFTLVRDLPSKHRENVSFDYIVYWRSSLTVAVAARLLAKKVGFRQAEEAFLAGLLQDIGVLVMTTCLPRAYEKVLQIRKKYEIPLADAEQRSLATDHTEIGGKLVESWGLPEVLSKPIRFHHQPSALKETTGDIALVTNLLNVADVVARVFCEPNGERLVELLKARAEECLHMSSNDVEDVLRDVGDEVRQAADLFELDIGTPRDYAEILEKANLSLGELGVMSATGAAAPQGDFRDDPGQLEPILTTEISRAASFTRPLGVMFSTLDGTDKLRQEHGDGAVLSLVGQLASVAVAALRGTDTVVRAEEPGSVVVSLPGCPPEALKGAAERVRMAAVEHDFAIGETSISLTVCVAAICYCNFDRNPTARQLLNAATKVLQQARERGPNTALFGRV